ncbi:exported protein of unknown function [Candidatus Hydrogenisulfobacillus filiaventi]|uniref:Uncharacterized protein n=1 Tax=Candidatus Hydrogenisulfobacillus filiaventi TaxID=2707344 RepID=A0A6F8ZEK7_9FIRM|nr:exported protein of unknown function [Candidatus Hydrogenisulfobacillus filiaventi]
MQRGRLLSTSAALLTGLLVTACGPSPAPAAFTAHAPSARRRARLRPVPSRPPATAFPALVRDAMAFAAPRTQVSL